MVFRDSSARVIKALQNVMRAHVEFYNWMQKRSPVGFEIAPLYYALPANPDDPKDVAASERHNDFLTFGMMDPILKGNVENNCQKKFKFTIIIHYFLRSTLYFKFANVWQVTGLPV